MVVGGSEVVGDAVDAVVAEKIEKKKIVSSADNKKTVFVIERR